MNTWKLDPNSRNIVGHCMKRILAIASLIDPPDDVRNALMLIEDYLSRSSGLGAVDRIYIISTNCLDTIRSIKVTPDMYRDSRGNIYQVGKSCVMFHADQYATSLEEAATRLKQARRDRRASLQSRLRVLDSERKEVEDQIHIIDKHEYTLLTPVRDAEPLCGYDSKTLRLETEE